MQVLGDVSTWSVDKEWASLGSLVRGLSGEDLSKVKPDAFTILSKVTVWYAHLVQMLSVGFKSMQGDKGLPLLIFTLSLLNLFPPGAL